MANINTNVFVDTKKFVDFAGLDYFWGKVKTYVDGVDTTLNTTLSELSDKHTAYETKTDAALKSIQDELSTLNGGVGSVGQQIENAITALNLPTTYETIANVAALKTELTEAIAAAKAGAETTAANALSAHESNSDIHVTAQQQSDWQAATDAINAFLDENAVKDEVVNTLKEIADYIASDETGGAELVNRVAALEDVKDDYKGADTALETKLTEAIASAKSEAVTAAAEDAATKANAAKEAAIAAAAADAAAKANTAKSEAIAAAAEDATTKANAAKSEAVTAAAEDAAAKANAAKEAAIAAAKADVAETLKGYYTKTNIDEMVTAINQSISDNSVADQAYAKTYTDELFHSIKFATTTDIDGMTGF